MNLALWYFVLKDSTWHVIKTDRNLLYYSLHGNRHCADSAAVGAARLVRAERLGQQLFPARSFAQSRLWRATIHRFRMDSWRGVRRRNSQPRHGFLGAD